MDSMESKIISYKSEYEIKPRFRHAAAIIGNIMYSFGGYDKNSETIALYTNLSLNLDTFVWKEIQTSNDIPPPAYGHTANTINDQIYLFGGYTDNGNTNALY